MKMIYEGKAKKIFDFSDNEIIMEFKDSLTAFNALKKGSFEGKGSLNMEFSLKIFSLLSEKGIPHHFLEKISPNQVKVKKLKMWPVEVVVRNKIAGSLAKKLGKNEGETLSEPLVEFYLKNDELGDPFLSENQLRILKILNREQILSSIALALNINKVLLEFFTKCGVDLVDFKIEIGEDDSGRAYLADEISPDSCRLWDQKTGARLDKDVFRRDLGDVKTVYKEIAKRIGLLID